MSQHHDIIVAPATMSGGAIAIIRLSGEGAIELTDKIFRGRAPLCDAKGHTLHYGEIVSSAGEVIDDVLVSVFRAPHSYTGEDGVEISCHGSQYITRQIIALAIEHGARMAEAGEFTIRAYMAGRMDLSQAEAVADMIAATSEASHKMASTQMRGGYSTLLRDLRGGLLKLVTLLELELDFSEEDVEFADRSKLEALMVKIEREISRLEESFAVGNAIKNGVVVAIVGEPNAGKSTLLNRLLNEDRAMVSEIAGTTRDVIEESITIKGITFRFVDTAGIHDTTDRLEQMGIERSYQAIGRAQIVIHLVDATQDSVEVINTIEGQKLIRVYNKIDLLEGRGEVCLGDAAEDELLLRSQDESTSESPLNKTSPKIQATVMISAKEDIGTSGLIDTLYGCIDTESLYAGDAIVSSARHYAHLRNAHLSLNDAIAALRDNIPSDLLCEDIRQVIHHIGSITGEINTEEVLGNIFSNFCIGK